MKATSVKNKLFMCAGILIFALLFNVHGVFAAYTTPGTGVSWDMDDLVTNSGGDITGSAGSYSLAGALTISAGDAVTMTAGDTLTATGNYQIAVEGTLTAAGEDGNRITFTSSGTTAGDWDGISVTNGTGNINLAYCDVKYGNYGVYFDEIDSDATPSVISHCNISNNSSNGIRAYYYNAASLYIHDSQISFSGDAGMDFSNIGNSEVKIEGNTIDQNGGEGFYLEYGGENVTLSGNTVTDNTYAGIEVGYGGWNIVISDNTISGNAGGIVLSDYSAGDNAVITENTISDNGDYGIYSYYSIGHTIEGNTVTGHLDTGIYLDNSWNELIRSNTITGNANGIYVEEAIAGRSAASAAYEWIEVNTNNADDWNIEQDDDYLDEAEIGFDFTLGNTTYTHFQVQTNGSIELATGSGLTNDISDYDGRGYITDSNSDSTIIFANTDDWIFQGATSDPYETHNGTSVRMDGWGYKHFNAGDTDGDGNTVSEECLVLRWYGIMISDDTYDSWNDFQVVLYPDGRVRWNTRFMNGKNPEYSQYSGIYAGADTTAPFDVTAGSGARTQSSFLYDPASYNNISTRIYANSIKSNTNYGLTLYDTDSHQIKGNEITENDEGIVLAETGYTSINNTIEYNNIFNNTTWDLHNYQDAAVTAESNYWELLTTAEIDAVINDDNEDATLGAVDFEPFLTSAVEQLVVGAGDDQTADEGDDVNLNGSVSDDAIVDSYLWEQTAGTTVTLSDASIENPVFTAPDVDSDETLTFRLTVTDIYGIERTDECDVQVIDIIIDTSSTNNTSDNTSDISSGGSGGSGLCFIGTLY